MKKRALQAATTTASAVNSGRLDTTLASRWGTDGLRPCITAKVLRHNKKPKFNITWDKDRGKDVESAPWFGVFGGERINDHHLTRAEKLTAKGT